MITLTRWRKGEKEPESLQLETFKEAKHAAFGFKKASIRCDSCAASSINGIFCHEHGCPQAWRDETRSCKNCGNDFKPTEKHQIVCDDACRKGYYGC